ncbi:MAG: hypothetical protein ACYCZF_01810 [Anaerolineae bacterium]
MTLSFRIGPEQWLTDDQFASLTQLLTAHRPAVDEISLFTHEAMGGFGSLETLSPEADLMRARIKQLHARGIRSAGINVLCTLGHGDPEGVWAEYLAMPLTVGHDGAVSTACPCPNSPEFRSYIMAKYKLFAAAKPDFIWVDDDLRMTHHGVLYPCFCPICLAKFGQNSDRAALVARMNDPQESELRRSWVEFNAGVLESVCADIGQAIREVDPSIEVGLMSIGSTHSTWGGHALGRWTAALGAVRGRPGHGFYWDDAPRGIFNKAFDVARQVRDYAPSVRDVQYELENYPYISLDKSTRTVLNEVALAIIVGCNGVAFNALKDTPGTLEDFEPLVSAIAAERPAWEALIAGAEGLLCVGLWPADDNALMGKRTVDARGWFWEGGVYDMHRPNQVVEMGIPLTTHPSTSCGTILAGKVAEAFTQAELRGLLARGVLMDGDALSVVWARGLGDLAGVRMGAQIVGGAVEKLTNHAFNGRFADDSHDALINRGDNVRCLEPMQAGVSDLAHLEGYDGRDHGCCMSAYENALGGRVVVSTYAPWRRLGRISKRSQLLVVADWLSYGKLPIVIEQHVRVAPFIRLSEDGSKFAVVLLNSTLDATGPLEVRLRSTAKHVSLITTGSALPLTVLPGDGEIRVTVPSIGPWQPAILLGS